MLSKTLNPAQLKAYQNLNIDPGNRIIISLDGGGIKGILTLQLLKKIEEIAGLKLNQFCDFFAGTSTGGIIAGLLANGLSANEVDQWYTQHVFNAFVKRNLLANRYLNPPEYDKKVFRKALKDTLGNVTLKEACAKNNIDILITSKNITDNEETFFTAFNTIDGIKGTYQDALLRATLEATMSAPTYFSPLERFLDGGTTTYANPTLAALMEAVKYDGRVKYALPKITLFSFGTGITVQSVSPKDAANPPGIDASFWLNYVMNESRQDAGSTQNDLLRAGLIDIDFRRFQVSLDTVSLKKLSDRDITPIPDSNAKRLYDLTGDDLNNIALDDVSKFDLMKVIGEAMVDYIMIDNKFQSDLNNTPTKRDELVTAFENISTIKSMLTSADWLDGEATA
jgi:predicted acylesterase/phospholipase RssA